ncbi:MAG: CoA transferase [Deltaproteobacteria bacterium]|nr:CoA transferase [Deltaproteobacteria bacterium]MBP7291510.1 CoA transferase [Nannocystaceae bacterium]
MSDDARTLGPLHGVRVVDASRMIPGAVLARGLAALGAEVIKLEDPRGGDPMRAMAPLRGGIGVGFALYYAGCKSVVARLGTPAGNAALEALVADTDVFVESFRAGTLARWGLAPETLRARHPRLVTVSLPGFPTEGTAADAVAHDLNALARTGLLERLGECADVPRVQLADVTCGLLAQSAVLAALLERVRTGVGRHHEQPLCSGALPHLTWPWSDAAASGAIGASEHLIGGRRPAYAIYRCQDGRRVAVGCLEPKFWVQLCALMGLPEHADAGLRDDDDGKAARAAIAARFADASAQTWAHRCAAQGLPVDVVAEVAELARPQATHTELAPRSWLGPLIGQIPMPDGGAITVPSQALGALERAPVGAAPRLGEHTRALLLACGATEATICECLAPQA